MQFWVYILRCRDGTYSTGHTDDLDKRLWQHREGKSCDWTRRRLPVELVWCDWAGTRYEALEFERRVKNWSRAKREGLIAGDWARVGYFAKPPHERPSTSPHGVKPVLSAAADGVEGLGTNEVGGRHQLQQPRSSIPDSFVPSQVEGRPADARAEPGKSA
ncbi:MAG: GIY-YIG nuclease family protein [Alphaproteobacteria bacterium]|nr:GIY-YIG nuclease family protein [Alphaproteobacteria bacterium]